MSFDWDNVTLISDGINTSYVCDYKCYESKCMEYIIKITLSKSFQMIGGILKYGTPRTFFSSSFFLSSSPHSSLSSSLSSTLFWSSFHFAEVDDKGYLLLRYIRLMFVGKMKSMIFIKGGSVCIEFMKIRNEEWIQPLIEAYGITSSVNIEIYMSNITDCNYACTSLEASEGSFKSGVLYIDNRSTKAIMLNISNCLFYNNVMNLFYDGDGKGNSCDFYSTNQASSLV
jgi:hypothetical protein